MMVDLGNEASKPNNSDASIVKSSRDLSPTQSLDANNPGNETTEAKTVGEILQGFTQREHQIGVFERARILFDPKMLPGITRQEALDFLIKGLRVSGAEEQTLRQNLNPEMANHIREHFPDFINHLSQENNARAVAEIWSTAGIDALTKLAFQWEFQMILGDTRKSVVYAEERATKTAADLKKLDERLKRHSGEEVIIRYKGHLLEFSGLNLADGKGLAVVENADLDNPYRDLVLTGPSAYSQARGSDRFDDIKTDQRLVIPFESRNALRTKGNENWNIFDDTGIRRDQYSSDDFRGVVIGKEIRDTNTIEADRFIFNNYRAFKQALDSLSPKAS